MISFVLVVWLNAVLLLFFVFIYYRKALFPQKGLCAVSRLLRAKMISKKQFSVE